MKFQKLFGIIVILTFTLNSFSNGFHTYHTSLTRMDYNAKDKLVEVTIQLFTHDLVPVLERQARQKNVDLETDSSLDKILFSYVNENFILKDEKDKALPLNWVGKEIKVDQVYIYFEIPFDGNFENLKLINSIFFESFSEQTNLVVFHFNDEKADLLFKVGDKFKDLKLVEEKKGR